MANEKYRYYAPIGKIGKFIDDLGSDRYMICALLAANGVGKTMAGAQILANLFWPCGNPHFQSELFKNWKYPKKVRIVSEPTTIKETLIPMLKEVFPKGRYGVTRYDSTKDGKTFESHWTTDTGWTITIMTYDQDPKEFESATLGLIWADEPPPESIYNANVSRLRRGGIFFITATPLMGSAYLYDLFVANPNREKELKLLCEADIEDACIEHGTRGFYTHDEVERIVMQYDPDERAARAFGKFIHLSGLVFKQFKESVHVIRPFTIDDEDYVVVHAFDCHPRVPDALLWVAIDKNGTHFVIDEFAAADLKASEIAVRVKKKEEGWRVVERLIDPSAAVVNQHTGDSLKAELFRAGLTYVEGSKARQQATRLLKDGFKYMEANGVMIKPPEIYIFDTCTKLIHEITHWKWEEYRGKTAETKGKKEKPEDKDDHFIEDLGRIKLANVRWTPKPEVYNGYLPQHSDDPYS